MVFPALVEAGKATGELTQRHSEDQESFAALSEILGRVTELRLRQNESQGRAKGLAVAGGEGEGEGEGEGGEERESVRSMVRELCSVAASLVVSVLEHLLVEEEEVRAAMRCHCWEGGTGL